MYDLKELDDQSLSILNHVEKLLPTSQARGPSAVKPRSFAWRDSVDLQQPYDSYIFRSHDDTSQPALL